MLDNKIFSTSYITRLTEFSSRFYTPSRETSGFTEDSLFTFWRNI